MAFYTQTGATVSLLLALRIFILQVMFYRSWLAGKEMRQAFDDTQRTFRMKYSNPYYWTGFVWVD